MSETSAIILGASGSVGKALLAEVLHSSHFARVIVIGRSALNLPPDLDAKVEQRLVPNMQPSNLKQATARALEESGANAVGFSVLGIGAGTAKLSIEQHRAVDVELNAAFAAALRDSGRVKHLVFMSAIGADANARTTGSGAAGMPRYARVKGEAEQAVLREGPAVVSILRPSVIIGSTHTPAMLGSVMSIASPLMPAKFRPIRTTEIARAMVALAKSQPTKSAFYEFKEMKALAGDAD
ncbi:MAG: NAD(P)H-binding protein [Rhodocyclaceae bacterium]|nr:NAD(P)H-binding protein [Rhodocyclaceae bacterium]